VSVATSGVRIGWIGAGRMGYAMAERLAQGWRGSQHMESYPCKDRAAGAARRKGEANSFDRDVEGNAACE